MNYKKGIAQGQPQINSDSVFFRYYDRTWEFPAYDVLGYKGIAHYNGLHYEASVKDLEKMEKKNGLRKRA